MMEEYSEAFVYLHKALSIVESTFPIDQGKSAESYCRLAECHFLSSEYEQALPLYHKSVDAFLQCPFPNERNVDKIYRRIEQTEELMGRTSD